MLVWLRRFCLSVEISLVDAQLDPWYWKILLQSALGNIKLRVLERHEGLHRAAKYF